MTYGKKIERILAEQSVLSSEAVKFLEGFVRREFDAPKIIQAVSRMYHGAHLHGDGWALMDDGVARAVGREIDGLAARGFLSDERKELIDRWYGEL